MTNKNHICSFVQRARRLTPKRKNIFDELSATYILNTKDGLIDYYKIFHRHELITLEIGFGMGDWLWHMITNQPEKNFIGIEVHQPGVAKLLEKLHTEPHNNIKIYNDDAMIVLEKCIPNNSLEQVLLFFPDPWPKRRQHKRRIVQPVFAQLIYKKLAHNGTFQMLTDCQDYAEHSKKVLQQTLDKANITLTEKENDGGYVTKFSQRAIMAGQKIYEITFVK